MRLTQGRSPEVGRNVIEDDNKLSRAQLQAMKDKGIFLNQAGQHRCAANPLGGQAVTLQPATSKAVLEQDHRPDV